MPRVMGTLETSSLHLPPNQLIAAERGKGCLGRLFARIFARNACTWRLYSSSEFSQVVPQDIDTYYQYYQGDDLPEELIRDDQCCYYSQPNVDAADQVCEPSPKACLQECKQGDAGDQRGVYSLSLEHNDPDEGYQHQSHAYGGLYFGHATGAAFVIRYRMKGTGDVGAGRLSPTSLQLGSVTLKRF